MARAHQAYKDKHGINCNPEILMTPPAVEEFLLPELDSEIAAATPDAANNTHHRKRRVSEPAAGAVRNGSAAAQNRPRPKRPR
eukprot:8681522-Lingulodinium_polyedra.AAC.1